MHAIRLGRAAGARRPFEAGHASLDDVTVILPADNLAFELTLSNHTHARSIVPPFWRRASPTQNSRAGHSVAFRNRVLARPTTADGDFTAARSSLACVNAETEVRESDDGNSLRHSDCRNLGSASAIIARTILGTKNILRNVSLPIDIGFFAIGGKRLKTIRFPRPLSTWTFF